MRASTSLRSFYVQTEEAIPVVVFEHLCMKETLTKLSIEIKYIDNCKLIVVTVATKY